MVQIPILQLVRVGALEITPVISDDVRIEIWDSFLSLQIKETTQRAYGKSLANFCQKIYPLLSIADALESFLSHIPHFTEFTRKF